MQGSRIANKTKVEIVQSYLTGKTTSEIIATFKIHPVTLWRWVQKYMEGGIESLTKEKKAWNKFPRAFEERIVALKEMKPSLTVSEARIRLRKQGINASRKGIWNVWHRYGYTGFIKENFSSDYQKYLYISPDIRKSLKEITMMIEENKIKEAAKAINKLPVIPETEVIRAIPERLLSLKRRVDKIAANFGKIPLSIYCKKAHQLRKELDKKRMHYSSLRAGIFESYALDWSGRTEELQKLCNSMKERAKGIRDPGLRFILLLFEGNVLAHNLEIRRTLQCIMKCKAILKYIPAEHNFMGRLAGLYTRIGYYRESMDLMTKAIKGIEEDYRKPLCIGLATLLATSGEYHEALRLIKQGKSKETDYYYYAQALLIKACAYLCQGRFQEASSLAKEALLKSKKEGILRHLHTATFILACGHAAVGNKEEAKSQLRRFNSLLRKYHFTREYLLRRVLLDGIDLPEKASLIPSLRLAYLIRTAKKSLRARDYQRAIQYARSQRLFGLFGRLVLFFPEPVMHLLEKGKDPKLPRAFMKMPLFQIEPFVYHLRFLGRLRILKAEKLISRLKLSPKDRSFIIHLSISKARKIALKELYRNFWAQSRMPSRNLSHLLVRIKKTLGLPQYLLRIRGDFLIWGFHLTTDYEYFEETLTQAKALERVGEWSFAKREYLRAFTLFRGEPFKKMYDPWSEHMRRVILNKLETEAVHFAKSCLERGNKTDGKRVLDKVTKIIPQSEESAKILQTLCP